MSVATFRELPAEFALPNWHPMALTRPRAYQCLTCNGIFYPTGMPDECPYCTEEDEEE